MKKSFKPGTQPLMSKELTELLSDDSNEEVTITSDDFDKIISDNNLRIKHFAFYRDLDLAVFVLNSKRIIQRPLSSYPALVHAADHHLNQYSISDSGIHWPDIDVDISLRGLLLEETIRFAAV